VAGYVLTNGINLSRNRPIYISSTLSQGHRDCVLDAVTVFNQYDHLYNPIAISYQNTEDTVRISYGNLRYTGYSRITGLLNDDNEWIIDDVSIYLNPRITFRNTAIYIILHELAHAYGLHHSDVEGAFMNKTLTITADGIVKDVNYPELQMDDIEGLYHISKLYH